MLIDEDICESCFLERMANPMILEYLNRGEMGIRYGGYEGECHYCGEYGPLVTGLESLGDEDEDLEEGDDFGYIQEDTYDECD